ncbi:MAG TPA: hypothetical protein VMH90_06880, partial [Thermoplasmata archaeon]|nr:hypothetical protein [Thermoplasmata archaeon]
MAASSAFMKTASREASVKASRVSWTMLLNCFPLRVDRRKVPPALSRQTGITGRKWAFPSGV